MTNKIVILEEALYGHDSLGCHRSSRLLFLGGVLFFCKEQFYVALRTKKFLHLVFRFAVVRVSCFLIRQQLGIFCIQFLDLGELFQLGIIESRFGGLVQCDLCAMIFQKSLTVCSKSL